MFEPLAEEDIVHTSIWDRIGNLFAFEPAELDQGEYDDLSGSQWSGGQQAGDPDGDGMDWEDEMAETVIIVLVVGLIMGLVWLRQVVMRTIETQRNAAEQRQRDAAAAAAAVAALDGDHVRQAEAVARAEEVRREQERRLEELERMRRERQQEQEQGWLGEPGELHPL
jgi:hypothetical protein